jgi:hypothetical protein
MLILEPLIAFLTAQNAAEATPAWPKGPKASLYRTRSDVPVNEYIMNLRLLEASPGLAGQSSAQLAQRLRRMQYSSSTEAQRPGASENADEIIHNTTYTTFSGAAPLTTEHVSQQVLDFFWSCDCILTARGHQIDISHLWMIVDLMLAGRSVEAVLGEAFPLDVDDLRPLLSWAGDLANVVNAYTKEVTDLPRAQRLPAARIQAMNTAIALASKSDLLADIDAVVLGHEARALGATLKLSTMVEDYYSTDALPQNTARDLRKACSARRFHYFIAHATPTLPADNVDQSAGALLNVSLKRSETVSFLKTFLTDVADDLQPHYFLHEASDLVDTAGRALYDKLCERFADFLVIGLATGDAPWPPTNWN